MRTSRIFIRTNTHLQLGPTLRKIGSIRLPPQVAGTSPPPEAVAGVRSMSARSASPGLAGCDLSLQHVHSVHHRRDPGQHLLTVALGNAAHQLLVGLHQMTFQGLNYFSRVLLLLGLVLHLHLRHHLGLVGSCSAAHGRLAPSIAAAPARLLHRKLELQTDWGKVCVPSKAKRAAQTSQTWFSPRNGSAGPEP